MSKNRLSSSILVIPNNMGFVRCVRDTGVPFIRSLLQFDRAIAGLWTRGISPTHGVEANEGDDEGVDDERKTITTIRRWVRDIERGATNLNMIRI